MTTAYPAFSDIDLEKLMLKFFRNILLVICASLVLFSCTSSIINLKYEDGHMVSKRHGLSYAAAPLNYQPVSVGDAYAYYEKADLTLYEIKGLDPKQWLTEEFSGASTTVFYSDKITLPTLRELGANKILICLEGEVVYSFGTIEDTAIINKVIDLFENGEAVEWPLIDSIRRYELKFYSEDNYPHIYFNLSYGEFPEGKFIYDRSTKRCVEIGALLDEYIG